MNRASATTHAGSGKHLLAVVLGLILLVASAVSNNIQAAPALTDSGAYSGLTQVADAILPKADRESHARISLPAPDSGGDTPMVSLVYEGLSFPIPAQASLPDPPASAPAAHYLSTRFSAPRAPPVSV